MFPLLKKSPEPAPSPRRLEILVADDVEEITALMGRWLEERGHAVTQARSGREVIECVRAQAFDIVVTDLVMPNGDGWDAIMAIGRLRPDTRILAISGGGVQMPVEACLRVAKGVGADRVLMKPFQEEEFIAAITQLASR